MARESIFARKRKERGKEWYNELKPDELIRMSENILTDIAYGNLSSVQDKWDLVNDCVIESLIAFCSTRCNNLAYICRCMKFYRDCQSNLGGGDNILYANNWDNIYNSYQLYHYLCEYLTQYKRDKAATLMVNVYSLCANFKNYINPNRFL